jgi:hypothetical protein
MKMRYYFDPETGQPHIYDHGVDEQQGEFPAGWDEARVRRVLAN